MLSSLFDRMCVGCAELRLRLLDVQLVESPLDAFHDMNAFQPALEAIERN